MLIAFLDPMPVAKKLIEEIEAFRLSHPGHEDSVNALLKAVRRIDTDFSGETRLALLREARTTFLQQTKTLEATELTLEALKKLHANQKDLIDALKKIVVTRPEGATLH